MKIRKMKIYALSLAGMLLINICLLQITVAQNKKEPVSVDDAALITNIKKQAETAIKNKDWTSMKAKELKETDRAEAVLPQAEKKLLSAEEIYERCSKGVIIVGRGNDNKVGPSIASGAILNEEGVCITNYHVLKDLIESTSASKSNDSITFFISTMDGKVFPVTDILSYSKAGDAAIFKIDARGEKLPAIPLGLSAKTGSKVYTISHPSGRHYFYSEGIVARNASGGKTGPDAERMEITADYARGSSGGPIVDSYGSLIGMVSSTSSIYYDRKEQKNLQMVIKSAIPISTIKRLFTSN